MQIALIEVPYAMGGEYDGGSRGALRYLEAGAGQVLSKRGLPVTLERVERGTPFRDTASASKAVNTQLAHLVGQALAAQQLPLVLTGSCESSLGVLAGFDHSCCGVIWCDAHADFNTPASTQSGFFAGMSLAIIAGHCYQQYWAQIGESTPVAEEVILLVGVRDLSPEAERERLANSGMQVVSWSDGVPQGDVLASLETLAGRVQEVYLHIDLDVFDPQVAPGLVDPPVRGGLSMEQMTALIRATTARFRIRAITLACYNPEKDQDDKTLQAGLRLLDLLAEGISQR